MGGGFRSYNCLTCGRKDFKTFEELGEHMARTHNRWYHRLRRWLARKIEP